MADHRNNAMIQACSGRNFVEKLQIHSSFPCDTHSYIISIQPYLCSSSFTANINDNVKMNHLTLNISCNATKAPFCWINSSIVSSILVNRSVRKFCV